jgi:hypothetical protein
VNEVTSQLSGPHGSESEEMKSLFTTEEEQSASDELLENQRNLLDLPTQLAALARRAERPH